MEKEPRAWFDLEGNLVVNNSAYADMPVFTLPATLVDIYREKDPALAVAIVMWAANGHGKKLMVRTERPYNAYVLFWE